MTLLKIIYHVSLIYITIDYNVTGENHDMNDETYEKNKKKKKRVLQVYREFIMK